MSSQNKETQEEIIIETERREEFLKDIVEGVHLTDSYYRHQETQFMIARRWNSWYPSYFKVDGGCYAIISGDTEPDRKKNTGVIVIDPGYRFLEILRRRFNIEPQDINHIIVTHYHPDHMAGLIEYANLRVACQAHCDIYLNETTYISFKNIQNKYISIHEITPGKIEGVGLGKFKTIDGNFEEITLKIKEAYHKEVGNKHKALGLIFEISVFADDNFNQKIDSYQIGIVGDTDGHKDYIERYVADYSDVDLLILHLGAFNNKEWGKGSKHLYINGVKEVLAQMRSKAEESKNGQKKLIVLSEFGLELGAKEQIFSQLEPYIENYSWRLLPIYVKSVLEKKNGFYLDMYAKAMMHPLRKVVVEKDNLDMRDEILCAFGFMVIAIDKELCEEHLPNVEKASLHSIKQYKERMGGIPISIDDCSMFKFWCNKQLFNKVQEFFHKFMERVLKNVEKREDERIEKTQEEALVNIADFIKMMVEHCMKALTSDFKEIVYMEVWDYVFRFARSIEIVDLKKSEWFYKDEEVNYSKFFTAVMVGLLAMEEETKKIASGPLPSPEEEKNILVQIADIFQEENKDWCKILIGDIGRRFKFDRENKRIIAETERWDPDKKTKVIEWLPPEHIELSYDEKREEIIYQPSKEPSK